MSEYLELWYSALASPFGIIIETDDFERARQRLYAARRESGDPALDAISVLQSPTDPSHIWLIRKSPDRGA